MRRVYLLFIICLSLVSFVDIKGQSIVDVGMHQEHPRLFLTNKSFDSIRPVVTDNESHPVRLMSDLIVSTADTIVSKDSKISYTFDSSGKRILEQSRAALRNILFCAYSYRLTGEIKYLDKAVRDIETVCSFPDWNAYHHFLDAAEMAMAVGIGYDWLYNSLSDELKGKIVQSLTLNAYEPSCDEILAWFYDADSNWNQVCNAGLSVAALATYETTDTTSQRIISEAVRTNKRAVGRIYRSWGNYPEGPGYWSYGTMFQCVLISALEGAGVQIPDISRQDGFTLTGNYKASMSRPSGLQYNYSDNIDVLKPSYPLWYFAAESGNAGLVDHEIELLRSGKYSKSDEFRLLPLIIGYALEYGSMLHGKSLHEQSTFYFGEGDTPIVVVQDPKDGAYMAVKGGRPVNPHSHLDGGSFVYDYHSKAWVIDLNRQDYETLESVADELDGDLWDMSKGSIRWDLLRLNNHGHSTLTINGAKHDVKGKATLVSVVDAGQSKGGTFDLSGLFEGQAARVLRQIILNGDGSLVISDTVAALDSVEASIKWNLVTPASVRVKDDGITLDIDGELMSLKTSSSYPVKYRTFSSDPIDYPSSVSSLEEKNPGITFCGFEAVVPKGKTAVFTTVLVPVQ